MGEIFQWIGVAASIGAVAVVLLAAGVFEWANKLWSRAKDRVQRWRVDWAKHGVRKGARYRLGVRLLHPYLEARWRDAALPDESERPPADDIAGRSRWDDKYSRAAGRRIELMHWVRLDGADKEVQ